MAMTIKWWDISIEETAKIIAIVDRFLALSGKDGLDCVRTGVIMDITLVHLHHRALDLERLLTSSDADLLQEVSAILDHLDRTTLKPQRYFVSRSKRTTSK